MRGTKKTLVSYYIVIRKKYDFWSDAENVAGMKHCFHKIVLLRMQLAI